MAVRFERIDEDLLLFVIGVAEPTAEEWSTWLTFIRAGRYRRPRVMVISDGGGPNAAQRRSLASVFHDYPTTLVAVLVDSFIARGIVTALGWTYGNFTAFPSDGLAAALRYLDREDDCARVTSAVDRLRAANRLVRADTPRVASRA